MDLTKYTIDKISPITGITIYGPKDPARTVGVVSFNLGNYKPEDLAYKLDREYGIMVRAGLHCSPCAHRTIGTINRGTVRIGIGYFNNKEEIDHLANALGELAKRE